MTRALLIAVVLLMAAMPHSATGKAILAREQKGTPPRARNLFKTRQNEEVWQHSQVRIAGAFFSLSHFFARQEGWTSQTIPLPCGQLQAPSANTPDGTLFRRVPLFQPQSLMSH